MADKKADSDAQADGSHERGTVTDRSGSPFPDPRAADPATPKPAPEVVPGQPMPSTDRPDDGGIRAVRPTHEEE